MTDLPSPISAPVAEEIRTDDNDRVSSGVKPGSRLTFPASPATARLSEQREVVGIARHYELRIAPTANSVGRSSDVIGVDAVAR
jgi:hypothetical protein